MKNEEGYVEFPSKLNSHSLEELELMDADYISPIVKQLLKMRGKPFIGDLKALKEVAGILTPFEPESRYKGLIIPKGMFYNETFKRFEARRFFNGRKVYVKSSPDPQVVIEALQEFCKVNNLEF